MYGMQRCQTLTNNYHSNKEILGETIFASIKGLNFIACGVITVTQVTELVLEDTIFQFVDGSCNALVLSELAAAI